MVGFLRRHLSLKIFLSYLIVIVVGMLVLATAAELVVPTAFERHMAAMAEMMGSMGRKMEIDLFANFRSAVSEALFLAATTASMAALVLSVFISRRVVQPIQEMQTASQRIAEGHFDERVGIPAKDAGQDLDELGRLALSFNQMAAQLERTETMRRDLIGTVAHELRTPLTSIKGYAEGLIDGVLPAEAATFSQIGREADRLQRLVYDLQELSRVEAGALDLNVQPVPVSRLFEAAGERLGRQYEEKGVAWGTDLPADLPPVLVDEDRIGQVLLNLLGNALHYTPSGGQVHLEARREGGWIRLSVKDTGIGISPEDLAHVFERFYRTDKSRSRAGGGTGIGLTIAKHLVEAHGGQIRASSGGPDQGSTFTFTIPINPD